MNPNWLGEPSVSIPNNTIVVNGVPVNVVPNVIGTSSNLSTWSSANAVTFYTASNVPPGTYMVGCETFTDPLTASNAGAGWNQGDYFQVTIRDKDSNSTIWPSAFHRPYTEGIQVSATAPYNKGSTDVTTCGVLVLTSNTNIAWSVIFGKDAATAYPQTRKLALESPWYQRIA